MLGINGILMGWHTTASLDQFGHVIGAAFEANLGYSILIKLGKFSDGRIGKWVDTEKLRIIPVMAENEKFNEEKFSKTLDALERRFHRLISVSNIIAIIWAVGAAVTAMIVLCITPYCAACAVAGGEALLWEFLLIGATPVGVAAFAIWHIAAIMLMRLNSREFDGLIKYTATSRAEKLAQVKDALREKLATARKAAE